MSINIEKLEHSIHKEIYEGLNKKVEHVSISLSNVTWEDFEVLRQQMEKTKRAETA